MAMASANPAPHQPVHSRRYAAYVLGLLLLINTFSYADRNLFSILIPAIKAEFGATDTVLGLIGGPGFVVSFVLLAMPFARLADRWSRRGVLLIAGAIWSFASAACGLAGNVLQLGVARLMVGAGEAGGLPPSQSLVSELYEDRKRASALGVLSSGTYFGLVLGLFGGAAVAAAWGWRVAFIALALPVIPLVILLWFTGPRRGQPVGSVAASEGGMLRNARKFWQIPSFRLLACAQGVFNIFGYAGAIWLPAYFMRSHGLTVVEAGAWLGLGAAAGGVLGSFAGGLLSDRLRSRGESWQLRVPAIGLLIAFPLFVAMFTLPGGASLQIAGRVVPVVALLCVFTGFFSALWAAPTFAAAARLVPATDRSQANALLLVIINVIGSAMGPLLAGIVSDSLNVHFGAEALRYSLLLMSLLTLVGGGLFWWASSHFPRDLERRAQQEAAGLQPAN